MNFSEEQIDEDRHDPQDQVIDPRYHLGHLVHFRHVGQSEELFAEYQDQYC